ncbi:hypothetical protein ACH5RR_040781 [Cinchona calisaya]|uniref:RNA polymerase Rpb2 domain-containing protein n=1 Tax=Cinchona calisaya TaxID=153742 RepID=A0ABD2XXR9_9GENT
MGNSKCSGMEMREWLQYLDLIRYNLTDFVELDYNGISVYTGTLISDWGGRSELEIDRKARIWARNNTFLLPRDILAAADHLIGLKFGIGTLDDMNHLKNKCIRSIADLLQDQFGLALVHLENAVRGTICRAIRHKLIPTPQNLDIQEERVFLARYHQEFLTIAWEQMVKESSYALEDRLLRAILGIQEKLVQEALDTLLDNGIRGQPMNDGYNKVYKSFSDVIEGKEGRFRETLLGK